MKKNRKENNYYKRIFLEIAFYINIIMLIMYFSTAIIAPLGMEKALDFFFYNESFINIRSILTIPVFILWINTLVMWSRNDKHVGRFLLLFFFIGIYTPFYFKKTIKKGGQ